MRAALSLSQSPPTNSRGETSALPRAPRVNPRPVSRPVRPLTRETGEIIARAFFRARVPQSPLNLEAALRAPAEFK